MPLSQDLLLVELPHSPPLDVEHLARLTVLGGGGGRFLAGGPKPCSFLICMLECKAIRSALSCCGELG